MCPLSIASDPKEAAAAAAIEAHHAQLAGELAVRVSLLLDTATRGPGVVLASRAGLLAFCERGLLPFAATEEAIFYPAAQATPQGRLLVYGMLAEHRRIRAHVEALARNHSAAQVSAKARALHALLVKHLETENRRLLPLLANAPGSSLADLLDDMHEVLGYAALAEQVAAAETGTGGLTRH